MMCMHSFIQEIATYCAAVYPELDWIENWILCVRRNERSRLIAGLLGRRPVAVVHVEPDRAQPPARANARAPPPSWGGAPNRANH
jgi:hypothetical protein